MGRRLQLGSPQHLCQSPGGPRQCERQKLIHDPVHRQGVRYDILPLREDSPAPATSGRPASRMDFRRGCRRRTTKRHHRSASRRNVAVRPNVAHPLARGYGPAGTESVGAFNRPWAAIDPQSIICKALIPRPSAGLQAASIQLTPNAFGNIMSGSRATFQLEPRLLQPRRRRLSTRRIWRGRLSRRRVWRRWLSRRRIRRDGFHGGGGRR